MPFAFFSTAELQCTRNLCHRVKLNTKMSTEVYCSFYATAFDVVTQRCGQHSSGSSYTTVRGRIRRYQSKNLSVGIKLLYCCVRQVCHLEIIVFIFPQLQRALKGQSYNDIQAIQTAARKELCSIPGSSFQDCFTDLQKSWKRCVDAGGSCFEGDA